MAKKRGSCLKKLVIGCAGIIGLFLLAGLSLTLLVVFTKPEEPKFENVATEDFVHAENEGLGIDDVGKKPIMVIARVSKASVKFIPDGDPGKITVNGEYDTANYKLSTHVKDRGDYIEYLVEFDTTRSLPGLIFGDQADNLGDNKLNIHLPSDRVLGVKLRSSMSDTHMDLTGLSVEKLDLAQSMGEFNMECLEPNKVDMKELEAELDMGQFTVLDFQNLRVSKVKFNGSMGESLIAASDRLLNDVDADVRYSMGEMTIMVTEDTQVDDRVSVFMGGYQGLRETETDSHKLTVRGSVTMGEMRVSRQRYKRSLRDALLRVAIYEGGEAARDLYLKMSDSERDTYDFGPDQLNKLGYDLLSRDRAEDAITIFQLNIEVHPHYVNGYDSLAEGYLDAGELEQAEHYYSMALELDPDFRHAQKMLDRVHELQRMEN
ncbi:MAG: hypothetical protein KDC35_09190 [Acidobacteria bacterium]|nr:hypothetical protein [Acidobacteriota bacterium]